MSLFLARLVLDTRSRHVRRDLADCHALHQRVLSGFPDTGDASPRAGFGILYRVDGPPLVRQPVLLVQSAVEPDYSGLPSGYLAAAFDGSENPAHKRLDAPYAALVAGDELAFRLRANPTRRIASRQAGLDKLAGKRVALLRDEEQIDWLRRKAVQGGFELLTVRTTPDGLRPDDTLPPGEGTAVPAVRAMPAGTQIGSRRSDAAGGRARLTFGDILFEGHLRVTDPERFRATLAGGIGAGKAYGFGLLSVAPVRIGAAPTR